MHPQSSPLKRCSKCGIEKPATPDFFHAHNPSRLKRAKDGLKPVCKDCRRATERERYQALIDKSAHIARAVAWGRRNQAKRSAISRRNHAKHPEQSFANDQIRRARIRDAFVERIERRVVFERDGGMCGLCHHPVDWADASVDHVIPLKRGGLHAYSNVQLAHRLCNARKGAQLTGGLPCSCNTSEGVL